tara:strand:+ start:19204 stop:19665 length:462 start_codon:yes stop_codon:yes gene_type:complete
MSIFEHIPFTAPYKYKRDPEFRDSERMAYLKDREYFDNYSGYPDYLNKIRKDIGDHEAMFDSRVQEELTKAYKLYENGEMTNDEFKYIEASLDELKKNKESLIRGNATFGVAPTTDEGVAKGQPRYKLMVMQDKNPFTKDLPQGDTLNTGDFR